MQDTKNDQEETSFPGYPHYPAKEDIMNRKENERVELDVENLSRSHKVTPPAPQDAPLKTPSTPQELPGDEDTDINTPTNESDLTADDLLALDDEGTVPPTVDALEGDEDLDIPGAEEDDADEVIGEEDEENNYYSLGGDAHENLEEDKGE